MFSRRLKVELSDETRAAFKTLEDDVIALTELVTDLVRVHRQLIEGIQGEIGDGVTAFEAEDTRKHPRSSLKLKGKRVPLPPQLAMEDPRLPSTGGHPKQTPFARAPRGVQVAWLLDVLRSEGDWTNPATIARAYAKDERHNRYLRRIISARLGEMYDDRHEGLERRDLVRGSGSLFEYRLVQ
jgi:hypothetical protein